MWCEEINWIQFTQNIVKFRVLLKAELTVDDKSVS
jgi:hypothetical protein